MPQTNIKAIASGDVVKAELIAVFDRCCYLQLCPQPAIALVCVGNPSIGPGPINLLVSDSQWRMLQPRLQQNDFADIGRNRLLLAGLCIDLSAIDTYQTPQLAGFCCTTYAAVQTRLASLLVHAQPDGLYSHVVSYATPLATASGAHAASIEAAMRAYLAVRVNDLRLDLSTALLSSDFSAASELLGAGAGLTPAGDDFLAGVMLGLRFSGYPGVASTLFTRIQPQLLERTNVISAALLVEAGAGRTSATLVATFTALGDPAIYFDARALAAKIDKVGHSSGWDCMAGVALVVQALAQAKNYKRSTVLDNPVQPSVSQQLTLTRQSSHA